MSQHFSCIFIFNLTLPVSHKVVDHLQKAEVNQRIRKVYEEPEDKSERRFSSFAFSTLQGQNFKSEHKNKTFGKRELKSN